MRNQWLRLLLLRCNTPSQPLISQVNHLRSFTSSIPHARAPHATLVPFSLRRRFTSSSPELAKPPSDLAALLSDIFSKPEISNDEIKADLDAKHVVITHDLILDVLKNPGIDSGVARRIFNWVSESKSEILSSNSYNLMLGILGGNGLVKESCELIGVMKEKGYGVKKGAFLRISERFMKDGASDDVERLKDLYATGSVSQKNIDVAGVKSGCVSRVSGIIRDHVWGDDVEKQLKESGVEFSSDLVAKVLGVLEADPNKALIFFRWLEDSAGFEHDRKSYNALARVLGKEDHSEKFWRLVDELSSKGHEMEKDAYFSVFKKFLWNEMIQDAVKLYELAMSGADKPSVEDFTMLLKKIVVCEKLDMYSGKNNTNYEAGKAVGQTQEKGSNLMGQAGNAAVSAKDAVVGVSGGSKNDGKNTNYEGGKAVGQTQEKGSNLMGQAGNAAVSAKDAVVGAGTTVGQKAGDAFNYVKDAVAPKK